MNYAFDASSNLTRQDTLYYINANATKPHQVTTACAEADYNSTDNSCAAGSSLIDVSYNNRGEITQKISKVSGETITWDYGYDVEGNLREVKKNGNVTNEFVYSSSGNRVAKYDYDDNRTLLTSNHYVSSLYEIVYKPGEGLKNHTKYIYGDGDLVASVTQDFSSFATLPQSLLHNTGQLLASMSNPLGSFDGLTDYISGLYLAVANAPNIAQQVVLFQFLLVFFVLLSILVVSFRARSQSRHHITNSQFYLTWLVLLCFVSTITFTPVVSANLSPGSNGAGVPVAPNVLFYHQDHLGSTVMVTGPSGEVRNRLAYEPYGEIDQANSQGDDVFRSKYAGKERDSASSLIYFGARYYDPELGRFISPDPDEQFHSPYLYGEGDPLSGMDPDGRFFGLLTMTIIGLAALGGAYAGGAAVNHSANPAEWDWESGKTWGGILGGAVIGAASGVAFASVGAAVGTGGAIATAVAEAGLTGISGSVATTLIGASSAGLIGGTSNMLFAAMGGATEQDLTQAFMSGFQMSFAMSLPVVGTVIGAASIIGDIVNFAYDPSAESGIALGMDFMHLGLMAIGARAGKKSSGGCSSFTASTLVMTESGLKNIEDITVGDRVWGYVEQADESDLYSVTDVFDQVADQTLTVQTADGVAIETTAEHLFYVEGKGWVMAKHLQQTDLLMTLEDDSTPIDTIVWHDSAARVYNFTVDNAHTYYVSSEEILVKNTLASCQQAKGTKRPSWKAGRKDILIKKQLAKSGKHKGLVRSAVKNKGARTYQHHKATRRIRLGTNNPRLQTIWEIDHIVPYRTLLDQADRLINHAVTATEMRNISNDMKNLRLITRQQNGSHMFEPGKPGMMSVNASISKARLIIKRHTPTPIGGYQW